MKAIGTFALLEIKYFKMKGLPETMSKLCVGSAAGQTKPERQQTRRICGHYGISLSVGSTRSTDDDIRTALYLILLFFFRGF